MAKDVEYNIQVLIRTHTLAKLTLPQRPSFHESVDLVS